MNMSTLLKKRCQTTQESQETQEERIIYYPFVKYVFEGNQMVTFEGSAMFS